MKYGVLLIGFEYIRSNKWSSLPGIPVDLYQVYEYSKMITNNILVFTDVDKDYKTSILQRAILNGYTDSNLLSFIEDIKELNQHVLYSSTKSNGYRINNFDPVVSNFISGLDRLFLYFTGHAKNGNIILPDNTHVGLEYIRDMMFRYTERTCEIVTILDCCESNGMKLPFNHEYKLKTYNFIPQNIICISSSKTDEESTATKCGSLFTRELFTQLKQKVNTIIPTKCYGSKIFFSYPHVHVLFSWFTKKEHNNLTVEVDNINSLIYVTLHNCQSTREKSSSIKNYRRYSQQGRYDSIY